MDTFEYKNQLRQSFISIVKAVNSIPGCVNPFNVQLVNLLMKSLFFLFYLFVSLERNNVSIF